ncbi:MAG TPA: efflux RND transporter periplasmic adaptor subunit [Candidatus Rubrimentiphilum sp.]|nr:efflux RND transporter periplasmic adaptor subunit [Candidatus Rubrimentiphilum sp.]
MAAGEAVGTTGAQRVLTRRRLLFLACGLVGVVVLIALTPRLLYAVSHVTTDDAYVDTYPAIVTAHGAGTVLDVTVHEGEYVKRGRVLVRLDDTAQRLELVKAQQALAEAQAGLAQALFDTETATSHHTAEALRAEAIATQSAERGSALRLQAQSDANAARAAIDTVSREYASLNAAEAEVPAAHVRLLNARKALQRISLFTQEGYVSDAQLETAQNNVAEDTAAYQAALSAVTQAHANLAAARAQAAAEALSPMQLRMSARAEDLGVTLAQSEQIDNPADFMQSKQAVVRSERARVSAAVQSFQLAEHNLSQMVLRSPVDGYVAARPATIGQTLQPGDTAVIVMPVNDLFVTANFKETQLDAIRKNAPADIHIDSFRNVRFYGHVESFGAAAQSALSVAPNTQISGNFIKVTQRVPVRVRIDSISQTLNQPLRPGMSAEVSIVH